MSKTFRAPKHEKWKDEEEFVKKESRERGRYKKKHRRRDNKVKMGCLIEMKPY